MIGNRPRIGVTVSRRSGWRIFPMLFLSLVLAGGRGVRWQAGRPADIDEVDGLVVGGGDDISAKLYGGRVNLHSRIDPERDQLELDLVRAAFERNKPVLGICRGAQMINIALGGTLHQDAFKVYGEREKPWTVLPRRRVEIEPGSRLARLAGEKPMLVNALHSQSVDRVGAGLRVVARDEFGMVQAVERGADPFVMGVQWHPEHLFYAWRQRRLFRALVHAAEAGRQGTDQHAAADGAAA